MGVNSYEQKSVSPDDNRVKATCDQEVWVKDRICTAIKMSMAIKDNCLVGADKPIMLNAIDGIADGATYEIIRTLGMSSDCINIKNPSSSVYSDRGNNTICVTKM